MAGFGFLLFKDFVQSAVQTIGSRLVSCFMDQWHEKADREDNIKSLESILLQLESHIEEAWDMPITNTALRHQLKCCIDVYKDWSDRLDKHKQQLAHGYDNDDHEESGQAVMDSSLQLYWGWWDRILPAPFNMKCLTSEDVQKVKQFVDSAKEMVAMLSASRQLWTRNNYDPQSNPHPMPLVRLLLQGESIRYETREGSETRYFCVHPVSLQDRGVEAALKYKYSDDTRPGEDFAIQLFLRFKDNTDIIGIAIQCFKSLQSQLKLLHYESAVGELQLLAGSQGTVTSWRALRDDGFEERYIQSTQKYRPDSFCCEGRVRGPRANSTVVSSGSDMFPEEVIMLHYSCIAGAAVNYSFGSTSKDQDVMPPLKVNLTFAPHCKKSGGTRGVLLEEMRRKERHIVPSLQEFLKIVQSNATKCFHLQHSTKYRALWQGNHGAALIVVEKSIALGMVRDVIEAFRVTLPSWANDPEIDANKALLAISRWIQAGVQDCSSASEYTL